MNPDTLIRATELSGRAVVDLDAAEKVGKVDRIVLDPDARRVAALLVSRGSAVAGDGLHMTVLASSIRAIGPDAVTIHRVGVLADQTMTRLEQLPCASDIIGRKVVSEDGRLLGRVDDVLIDRSDGRILGYTLGDRDVLGKIGDLIAGDRKRHHASYLRADADLRTGPDLIIAPDDAVSDDWSAVDHASASAASHTPDGPWAGSASAAPLQPDAAAVTAPVPESPTAVPSVQWKDPTELPAARATVWVHRGDTST